MERSTPIKIPASQNEISKATRTVAIVIRGRAIF